MTTQERFIKLEKARRYPQSFLHLVKTKDPHEQDIEIRERGKSFPTDKEYIKILVDRWIKERLNLWAKSRQVLLTWICVALYTWLAVTKSGQYVIFRSEKLGKAGDKKNELTLLGRAMFIVNHLPKEFLMHCWGKDYELDEPRSTPLMMWKLPNGSIIHCISANPHDAAGINATGCLDDEKAYQENQYEADEAMGAALGTVGKWTKISSVVGGTHFHRQFLDEV